MRADLPCRTQGRLAGIVRTEPGHAVFMADGQTDPARTLDQTSADSFFGT